MLDNFRNFKKFPELATLKGISSLTFLFGQTCCCCSVQNFCKNTLSWETFLPIRCKICCCYLNYNFKVLKKKKPRKCKTIFLKNMRYLWKRGKNITFLTLHYWFAEHISIQILNISDIDCSSSLENFLYQREYINTYFPQLENTINQCKKNVSGKKAEVPRFIGQWCLVMV